MIGPSFTLTKPQQPHLQRFTRLPPDSTTLRTMNLRQCRFGCHISLSCWEPRHLDVSRNGLPGWQLASMESR